MNRLLHFLKRALPAVVVGCALFANCGCATTSANQTQQSEQLPPLLAQDELLRPYQKVATLQVRRARWGHPGDLAPADYDWAYDALRREASRIGADAVITPEVRVELESYLFYPMSEINARGIAIKFQ